MMPDSDQASDSAEFVPVAAAISGVRECSSKQRCLTSEDLSQSL